MITEKQHYGADFLSIDDVCSATISTCVLKYAVSKDCFTEMPPGRVFFFFFFHTIQRQGNEHGIWFSMG